MDISFNSEYVQSLINALNKCRNTANSAYDTFSKAGSYTNFKRISMDSSSVSNIYNNISAFLSSISKEISTLIEDKHGFEMVERMNINDGLLTEFLDEELLKALAETEVDSSSVDTNSIKDMTRRDFFKWFSYNGFDTHNYGINQSIFKSEKYNKWIETDLWCRYELDATPLGTVSYIVPSEESERLQNFLVEKYHFSKLEADYCLDLVDSLGACTYTAIANGIIYEYKDEPEKFEETFGFPLYTTIDGKEQINGDQLLLDMFVHVNSITTKDGFLFLTDDGESYYINPSENTDKIKVDENATYKVEGRISFFDS